ncbi:MAG: type 4a pilus biogenesis protein PilO [Desulfamplus sp.]|nr:type 4a pilus biogenesis protein PilO [Desulfamplus sp.]
MKEEEKDKRKALFAQITEKTAPVIEKIGNLSRKQRLLICLGTLAVLTGVYYYFLLAPRLERITSLEKEHATLSERLRTYKRKAASLDEFENRLQAAESDFYTALMALPDKKEIPSLLTAVSKSGNDAGLEFLLFKPESEAKKDFYAEIPVSIKVEGGYHQIAEFFDRVAQLSRLVNIQNIVINAAKGSNLSVSCRAVTYMFVEKSDTGEKAKAEDKRKRRK